MMKFYNEEKEKYNVDGEKGEKMTILVTMMMSLDDEDSNDD